MNNNENATIDMQVINQGDILILTAFNLKTSLQHVGQIKGKVLGFSELFYTDKEASRQLLFNNIKKNHFQQQSFPNKISAAKEHDFLQNVFEQLELIRQEQLIQKVDINVHIIKNLLTTILLIIQKRTMINAQIIAAQKTNSKNLVAQFIGLLDKHYKTETSIKFYIDTLSTTDAVLKNQCKKILGLPPKELMQQKVIVEAKRLLLNSDISIQQVAYNLGYSDPTNFNKFFHKRVGITPNEFRKNASNNVQSNVLLP